MERELRILRRELDQVERGRGRKYGEDLRRRITAWCRRRRAASAGLRELSVEIGVSAESVRRWLMTAAESDATALRPVEIVAATEQVPRDADPTIRVVTPSGYRIEGLAIGDVIAIVRVLG